jgi:hypothetical protein
MVLTLSSCCRPEVTSTTTPVSIERLLESLFIPNCSGVDDGFYLSSFKKNNSDPLELSNPPEWKSHHS